MLFSASSARNDYVKQVLIYTIFPSIGHLHRLGVEEFYTLHVR